MGRDTRDRYQRPTSLSASAAALLVLLDAHGHLLGTPRR